MTKSDLIQVLTLKYAHLPAREVEVAVKAIVDHMAETLSKGGRIEIRGFGSFSVRYRAPRIGRNPKTGTKVDMDAKYVPYFKPGKDLRDRVNEIA